MCVCVCVCVRERERERERERGRDRMQEWDSVLELVEPYNIGVISVTF